jgi:hypothetical protein
MQINNEYFFQSSYFFLINNQIPDLVVPDGRLLADCWQYQIRHDKFKTEKRVRRKRVYATTRRREREQPEGSDLLLRTRTAQNYHKNLLQSLVA